MTVINFYKILICKCYNHTTANFLESQEHVYISLSKGNRRRMLSTFGIPFDFNINCAPLGNIIHKVQLVHQERRRIRTEDTNSTFVFMTEDFISIVLYILVNATTEAGMSQGLKLYQEKRRGIVSESNAVPRQKILSSFIL